ncbi:MAG TPA: 23S rRNA (adenine(2030)-N(6))-methyltransferase RlmJ [Kribbella sp.]
MANHHFGKFADVWKHLVLNEVLADAKPKRYAETHAGSAAYPLADDTERQFGVLGFLEWSRSRPLTSAAFTRVVSEFASKRPALYPGSALQAMTVLGNDAAYLLCDLDPVSARDLRSWATSIDLSNCEVVERDGMAAVQEWLPGTASTVVHIDPFDPFAHEEGVPSAVELAAKVAEAGHTLVYWYGYSAPSDRAWAVEEILSGTGAKLWSGDFLVTAADGTVRDDGDLGEATSAGTGSGIVLANVSEALVGRCEKLATALLATYQDRRLPSGTLGRLDLVMGTSA